MEIQNKKALKESINIIANTESIEPEEVITILEEHLFPKSIRQNYSKETIIETKIDRNDFSIMAFQVFEVVPDDHPDFNGDFNIYLSEAKKMEPNIQVNDRLRVEIKDFDIQKYKHSKVAKQFLLGEINKLKKRKVREKALLFQDQLMSVVVKKFDLKRKVYYVEFNGEFSGIIPFSELSSPDEKLKVNERYISLLTDIELDKFQEQVVFTRKGKDFLMALFKKEIPEINDEIIEVKNIYIDKGKNIFVSVYSNDKNIDPVGTFVGVKGNRVSNILKHINGGNIDVSKWSNDYGEIITETFKDLNIEKIAVFDNQVAIFLSDDDFKLISDRNKRRLKSINSILREKVIITTEDLFEKSNENYKQYFQDELNLDEDSAALIANSGFFRSIDDLLEYDIDVISEMLEIEEDGAEFLIERAQEKINARDAELALIDTNLKDIESLKNHHLKMLLDKGIKNIPDLADFANDELCEEIVIDIEDANDIIMEARDIIYN